MKPRCQDCLSEDVAVRITGICGSGHYWFCARDWAAHLEFRRRIMKLLDDTPGTLDEEPR